MIVRLCVLLCIPVVVLAQVSLVNCCRTGDCNQLGSLLRAGADPNEPAEGGAYPLTWACQIQCIRSVRMLLEYGADPNVNSMYGNESILFRCARLGDYEIVKALLEHDAEPDVMQTLWVQTPIQVAAAWGRDRICSTLLDYGADPTQINQQGNSLMFMACQNGLTRTALKLLAKVPFTQQELDEYMYVAKMNARERILRILEDYESYLLIAMASGDQNSFLSGSRIPEDVTRRLSHHFFSEHLEILNDDTCDCTCSYHTNDSLF